MLTAITWACIGAVAGAGGIWLLLRRSGLLRSKGELDQEIDLLLRNLRDDGRMHDLCDDIVKRFPRCSCGHLASYPHVCKGAKP